MIANSKAIFTYVRTCLHACISYSITNFVPLIIGPIAFCKRHNTGKNVVVVKGCESIKLYAVGWFALIGNGKSG